VRLAVQTAQLGDGRDFSELEAAPHAARAPQPGRWWGVIR
jgi:hypothetical protein